jgi:hypothetical protein
MPRAIMNAPTVIEPSSEMKPTRIARRRLMGTVGFERNAVMANTMTMTTSARQRSRDEGIKGGADLTPSIGMIYIIQRCVGGE